jgi:hypothetical protein
MAEQLIALLEWIIWKIERSGPGSGLGIDPNG